MESARFLGLDIEKADDLFRPTGSFWYLSGSTQSQYIAQEHAARCLEHLAETGKVDWEASVPEEN